MLWGGELANIQQDVHMQPYTKANVLNGEKSLPPMHWGEI